MIIAFRKYRYSWFVIFCLAAILAIITCNVWGLCCGQCVLSDFLRIPPIGWVLIYANLAAGFLLLVVKRREDKNTTTDRCGSCYTALRDKWLYCPNCGNECPHGN